MQSKHMLALLGLDQEAPWELVDQALNTEVELHELHLRGRPFEDACPPVRSVASAAKPGSSRR